MNKRDAELIGEFVAKMIAAPAHLRERIVARLVADAEGTPGTGVCICPQSPDRMARTAKLWNESFETVKLNMLLDHRCPHHGEKAQPALWGRHKEKVLEVKAAEWLSLGITSKEPQT